MTRVTRQQYNDRLIVEIGGHACGAQEGPDLVCAAVSALACTLVACCEQYLAEGRLQTLSTECGQGRVMIDAVPYADTWELMLQTTDVILTGFSLLAEEYPACVSVED